MRPRTRATPSERGRIFSFCSAKGGTGTTSLCINTAYALAKLEPRAEILVVDMVFPIGSVAPSLGYEPQTTVVKLSHEPPEPVFRTLRWYEKASKTPNLILLLGYWMPLDALNRRFQA
jgi:Mrp family chromosome partitioning ATPase